MGRFAHGDGIPHKSVPCTRRFLLYKPLGLFFQGYAPPFNCILLVSKTIDTEGCGSLQSRTADLSQQNKHDKKSRPKIRFFSDGSPACRFYDVIPTEKVKKIEYVVFCYKTQDTLCYFNAFFLPILFIVHLVAGKNGSSYRALRHCSVFLSE